MYILNQEKKIFKFTNSVPNSKNQKTNSAKKDKKKHQQPKYKHLPMKQPSLLLQTSSTMINYRLNINRSCSFMRPRSIDYSNDRRLKRENQTSCNKNCKYITKTLKNMSNYYDNYRDNSTTPNKMKLSMKIRSCNFKIT